MHGYSLKIKKQRDRRQKTSRCISIYIGILNMLLFFTLDDPIATQINPYEIYLINLVSSDIER